MSYCSYFIRRISSKKFKQLLHRCTLLTDFHSRINPNCIKPKSSLEISSGGTLKFSDKNFFYFLTSPYGCPTPHIKIPPECRHSSLHITNIVHEI